MKSILQSLFLLVCVAGFSQTPIYKWDFDGNMNNSGSATIPAWTPNGTGASTYVSNRFGQANTAINIPNTLGYTIDILNGTLPSGNAARTFCFWAKFVNDNDNKSYPVVGWGNASGGQAFGFWRNGFQNSYYTWGTGNDYNIPQTNSQIQASNNGWVHVAMTHDGTNLAIYYNGVNSTNALRTLNTGNQYFGINRLVSASAGTGDAIQLDDLRIYNTALTNAQIQNIYNQTVNAAPTIGYVSVSNLSTTSATINYDVNANNIVTTTEIRYAVTPSGTLQIQSGPNATGSTNTTLSQNLTGLQPNTTYEYAVWAMNSQGTVFSTAATFTTGSTTPAVISGVTSNSITNVTATINFNINTNGVNTPTTVNYGTSPTSLSSSVSGPIVNSTNATPTNINISGLTANTTYYYQVVATNANGITSSNVFNFTTLATPPTPTPIYHYKFSGNLNEENGGPALTLSPLTGTLSYSFPNNSELLLQKDNLNRTPFFTATLPNLPQGNTARTVSVRINYESGALASENNVFSWGTSVNDQAYGFSQTSSNANNYFWGPNDLTFPMPTNFATWYTLTFVYNGSFVSIYRDGSLWQQAARNLNTNGTVLNIGATPNVNSPRFLHARIDDLQIYNTALSAAQIAALNNQLLSSKDFTSNNLNFVMYPNPVDELLNLDLENEIKSVEIYSLQGQKVLVSKDKQLNVSNLSNGIYMVKVEDVNGNIATQKLVKK